MSNKRRRDYTDEFKKGAVSLALKSSSVKKAADRLGVPEGTLNNWMRNPTSNKKTQPNEKSNYIDLAEELKKLRKENARLREEREILKKAATFFAKESK